MSALPQRERSTTPQDEIYSSILAGPRHRGPCTPKRADASVAASPPERRRGHFARGRFALSRPRTAPRASGEGGAQSSGRGRPAPALTTPNGEGLRRESATLPVRAPPNAARRAVATCSAGASSARRELPRVRAYARGAFLHAPPATRARCSCPRRTRVGRCAACLAQGAGRRVWRQRGLAQAGAPARASISEQLRQCGIPPTTVRPARVDNPPPPASHQGRT